MSLRLVVSRPLFTWLVIFSGVVLIEQQIIPHSDSADLHALLTGASSETAGVADPRHTFLTVAGSDHGYSKPDHAAAAVQHVLGWLLPRLSALRDAQQ